MLTADRSIRKSGISGWTLFIRKRIICSAITSTGRLAGELTSTSKEMLTSQRKGERTKNKLKAESSKPKGKKGSKLKTKR